MDISSTDRSSSSGFKSSSTGFNLGTGFEQYEDFFFTPKLVVTHEDVEVDESASASIKKMEGSFINADLTYGLTLDKRNQSWKPTEGYITSFVQS